MKIESYINEDAYQILKGNEIFMPDDVQLYDYYKEIEFENGTLLLFWRFNSEYVNETFFDGVKILVEANSKPNLKFYWRNKNEDYQKPVNYKYFNVDGKAESLERYYLKFERMDNSDPLFKKKIIETGCFVF